MTRREIAALSDSELLKLLERRCVLVSNIFLETCEVTAVRADIRLCHEELERRLKYPKWLFKRTRSLRSAIGERHDR